MRQPKVIRKKCWPNIFERMLTGKKMADLRLADFEIREGDTLLLEEYAPIPGTYTGRTLSLLVKNLTKVQLLDFHSHKEVLEHQHWLIELEDSPVEAVEKPSFKEWLAIEEPQYSDDLMGGERALYEQVYKLEMEKGPIRVAIGKLLTELKRTAKVASGRHSQIAVGYYLNTIIIPKIEKALGVKVR